MNESTMRALFRAQLPTRAVAVLGYILTRQKGGDERLSQDAIGDALGMSYATVARAIKDLRDEGILSGDHRPFSPTEYTVNEEVLKRLAKP